MYIYSSLYIGDFFLFLLAASNINPIKLYFKEHETTIKSKKISYLWKEKIYLYPAILQRKWIDYKYKDRFIPFVKYDNILPLELSYNFLNSIGESVAVKIKSTDKNYKNVFLKVVNSNNITEFQKRLNNITSHQENIVTFTIKIPGIYTIIITVEGINYHKSKIIFYNANSLFLIKEKNDSREKNLSELLNKNNKNIELYCCYCKSRIYPIESKVISGYIYKNYIPFKEYIDIKGLGMDYISNFIMNIPYNVKYKRGLVHLLNIIRLASIEDELTIITNLFKDDPRFAYFITDKLFLLHMIPIMVDRELQKILNKIDDEIIAQSLFDEDNLLVSKVMRNISKRRARTVRSEMFKTKTDDNVALAKDEMHKQIKTFFEERIGRVLKIPESTKVVYTVRTLSDSIDRLRLDDLPYHTGDFIITTENEIYQIHNNQFTENCLRYDIESYKDFIFIVNGISESSIHLKSEIAIRYSFIHIYDWQTNLENSEIIENVSSNTVIPIKFISSELILTVGAIDSRGNPKEQVIRLKIK